MIALPFVFRVHLCWVRLWLATLFRVKEQLFFIIHVYF